MPPALAEEVAKGSIDTQDAPAITIGGTYSQTEIEDAFEALITTLVDAGVLNPPE